MFFKFMPRSLSNYRDLFKKRYSIKIRVIGRRFISADAKLCHLERDKQLRFDNINLHSRRENICENSLQFVSDKGMQREKRLRYLLVSQIDKIISSINKYTNADKQILYLLQRNLKILQISFSLFFSVSLEFIIVIPERDHSRICDRLSSLLRNER